MAHIDDGGNDKKNIAVELNLVPFIDLMSVCIIFLLITAVWTQVSMIQLGSSLYAKKTEDQPVDRTPPPSAEIVFRVSVLETGFDLLVGKKNVKIPNERGKYDSKALLAQVRKVKEIYPEKRDVVVAARDRVRYEHLIEAMDVLLVAGFPEISVATGEM